LYGNDTNVTHKCTFGILYGSGARSVAETVTKASGEYFSVEDAQSAIDDYFKTFHVLKKWLNEQKKLIQTQGYVYSFFNRKRRLSNVFSPDKGIAAHEVRSGINALIQSLASDMNLIAAMEAHRKFRQEGLHAYIFMLVHDSIVIHAREDCVDRALEILKECTQRDRGCSIPNFPIGIDQDVGDDYSFGKFEEKYSIIDDILVRISEEDKSIVSLLDNVELDDEELEE
jgi:DNA polymerase-1